MSEQERETDESSSVIGQSYSKTVLKFILKDIKELSVTSVLESGKQLEPFGCVYQLMSLLVAVCVLSEELTPDSVAPLFQRLIDYNASPTVSVHSQPSI